MLARSYRVSTFVSVSNIVVSSAKDNIVVLRDFDMSLIYNKNSSGPKIEPCGTPHETSSVGDLAFSIQTNCFRSVK